MREALQEAARVRRRTKRAKTSEAERTILGNSLARIDADIELGFYNDTTEADFDALLDAVGDAEDVVAGDYEGAPAEDNGFVGDDLSGAWGAAAWGLEDIPELADLGDLSGSWTTYRKHRKEAKKERKAKRKTRRVNIKGRFKAFIAKIKTQRKARKGVHGKARIALRKTQRKERVSLAKKSIKETRQARKTDVRANIASYKADKARRKVEHGREKAHVETDRGTASAATEAETAAAADQAAQAEVAAQEQAQAAKVEAQVTGPIGFLWPTNKPVYLRPAFLGGVALALGVGALVVFKQAKPRTKPGVKLSRARP